MKKKSKKSKKPRKKQVKDETVLRELEFIRRQSGGVLYPDAVVSFAEDENTALHSKFDWNDTSAGHKYRVWQARQLIKIIVIYEPSINKEITVYSSLTSDREDEGGYRATMEILNDENLRQQLLFDALRDFDYWKHKYIAIRELIPIFEARQKIKSKKRRGKKHRKQ